MEGDHPFAMWDEKEKWDYYLENVPEGKNATREVIESLILQEGYKLI